MSGAAARRHAVRPGGQPRRIVERYLRDGFTADAVAAAPSLAWNRDDALQDMLVRKAFRRSIARPVHYVPTAEGFGAAVRAGLGWGMFPEQLAGPALADGSFVRISEVAPRRAVVLAVLEARQPDGQTITEAVRAAAAELRER